MHQVGMGVPNELFLALKVCYATSLAVFYKLDSILFNRQNEKPGLSR